MAHAHTHTFAHKLEYFADITSAGTYTHTHAFFVRVCALVNTHALRPV